MKGNYLYIACGFVLAGMMACTNDTPGIRPTDEEASRIYLSAGVGGPVVSSRTPYMGDPTEINGSQYEVPTMTQPLDVSVWASTTSGSFLNKGKDGSDGTVAIHTQAHFQSGAPQLLGQAIYPKNDNTPVHFVSFHPKSDSWNLQNDNNSANFTFSGKEDVMFAPRISGTYGIDYENSPGSVPTFHFRHLLTWLRIEMIADMDEEDVENRKAVAEAWGEIVSMTISSKNQVTVNNLSEEGFNSSNVIFSGEATDMKLYHTDTDNVFPNAGSQMIPYEKLTEVAYVMCAPVVGQYIDDEGKDLPVPEYTLHIQTTKRDVHIPIDLMKIDGNAVSPFTVNTMGYQFIIQLNFKMGNVIGVSAAISLDANTDWFTHGTGSTDLKEEHFNENKEE